MFNENQLNIKLNLESIQNEHTSKSFFSDNSHILEKGSISHTITENDDNEIPMTIITREYSSFCGTCTYTEKIVVASSVFKERKKLIIENINVIDRMNHLKDELRKHAKLENFEMCKAMHDELKELERVMNNI